jgi:hypothetical protein
VGDGLRGLELVIDVDGLVMPLMNVPRRMAEVTTPHVGVDARAPHRGRGGTAQTLEHEQRVVAEDCLDTRVDALADGRAVRNAVGRQPEMLEDRTVAGRGDEMDEAFMKAGHAVGEERDHAPRSRGLDALLLRAPACARWLFEAARGRLQGEFPVRAAEPQAPGFDFADFGHSAARERLDGHDDAVVGGEGPVRENADQALAKLLEPK